VQFHCFTPPLDASECGKVMGYIGALLACGD
jgi:hypothetical protein